MQVQVLGAGAGGGFPQWNCNCQNCSGYRKGSIRASRRTQSSISVSHDSLNWVLFNASPDLLTQIQQFPKIQPARHLRDTGIRSIVLIDSQIDHTTGLLMLRESPVPLRIYCTEAVYEDLTSHHPLFTVLSNYCKVDWQPIRFQNNSFSFTVPEINHLRFTAYPLKSKAPPYSPRRQKPSGGETIGVWIEDTQTGGTLFYAPGLGEIEAHLPPLFEKADCLLIDGTFWSENEMETLGIAKKNARDLGHLPQSGPGGMIEVLSKFQKPRKILIHINNTNPILNEDSAEFAELSRQKIEVAKDQMEITL